MPCLRSPKTLHARPFLAYDREGKLVSSIHMVPLKDLDAQKALNNLGVAKEKVDHVDLDYNEGHPGTSRAPGTWRETSSTVRSAVMGEAMDPDPELRSRV